MITKYGEMDESLLERKDIYTEVNGNKLHKIEWHYQGEIVKDELNVELCQLNLVGEQAYIGYSAPELIATDDVMTLSIEDAIQILTAIHKSEPNTCVDMLTNVFNIDKDTNSKLEFRGKFYVNGKEVIISLLPKNITPLTSRRMNVIGA